MAVDVAEGQRNDAPPALPVLAEAGAAPGRIDEAWADRAFAPDEIRSAILEVHDALPVVPNRRDRTDPRPWDDVVRETYRERNRIERAFGKAKQYRWFATRYEEVGRGLPRAGSAGLRLHPRPEARPNRQHGLDKERAVVPDVPRPGRRLRRSVGP